jgi:tRNA(Ile)-lysidine synthase
MKKLSPIAFRALFFKHVWRFLKQVCTTRELEGGHVVAVSGGLDSMCLLWFANSLHQQGKIGPVRAIFVHHHTRDGQDEDRSFIEKFCKQEKIDLEILHAEGLDVLGGNFEARARKTRRELCFGAIKDGELLWAGHHLNDSYEWNLMQRHRSHNPKAMLGIPVRNGVIVRPFLCVSRPQIKKLSKFEAIPYRDDPSNKDLQYDRNYARLEIIPKIRDRYPRYLKFYAQFANFSAMMLNLNILHRSGPSRIYVFNEGAIIQAKHFSEVQIQELLHDYSNADRGEIISPIQKMIRAIDNGKKGPFHFSGGMEIYHSNEILMIYRQSLKNYDENIARVLGSLSIAELQGFPLYKRVELQHAWSNLLQQPDAMLNMPGLIVVLESESICKTLNTSVFNSLFPKVSAICQERGFRFTTFTKCMDTWSAKKEKLPERLKLLPLYHLSNLFASQQ